MENSEGEVNSATKVEVSNPAHPEKKRPPEFSQGKYLYPMKLSAVISFLETLAPPALQESYDNCGLLCGDSEANCTGILCTLDVTEAIVEEAKQKNCNLIVAHHPIIFTGLKKITGSDYVQRTILSAIKKDMAIYAIHTSLDNVSTGVNSTIADKLELSNRRV